ncbi:hypothetical protein SRABI27_05109 [Pedobacter sp. Bi27]|nr:hypothetical protein SRABI36_05077 [Pedobacter sp. Bi36]CAH0317990.1 hypothetical protein SRABI27_05109 [Pedobacter sp. Bi27]CAH0318626.1 hypothetical protein SRABI126_05140 [Pedobacter sp. Bi126]
MVCVFTDHFFVIIYCAVRYYYLTEDLSPQNFRQTIITNYNLIIGQMVTSDSTSNTITNYFA